MSERTHEDEAQDPKVPPISGRRLDPPPKALNETVDQIMRRHRAAGVGYRAFIRFSYAKATLLAAGTTYYVFLSLFALVALGYGVAAILGSEQLSDAISEGLVAAFPGITSEDGSAASSIRSAGQTTSIVGLAVLLYSGSAAMYAASRSLHFIYGAPKDPRGYVRARLRLLAWLLVIAPLALLSYLISGAIVGFANDVFSDLGITGPVAQGLVLLGGLVFALALDFLVMFLLLSRFGGILPRRSARLVGAGVGAVAIEGLKYVMALIVAWSLSQQQYGVFATSIAALLVIYLQCITLFLCAALTGALSEEPAPDSESKASDASAGQVAEQEATHTAVTATRLDDLGTAAAGPAAAASDGAGSGSARSENAASPKAGSQSAGDTTAAEVAVSDSVRASRDSSSVRSVVSKGGTAGAPDADVLPAEE